MPLGEHHEQRPGRPDRERGERLHQEQARDESLAQGEAEAGARIPHIAPHADRAPRAHLAGVGGDRQGGDQQRRGTEAGRVDGARRTGAEQRDEPARDGRGEDLDQPPSGPGHGVGG